MLGPLLFGLLPGGDKNQLFRPKSGRRLSNHCLIIGSYPEITGMGGLGLGPMCGIGPWGH